MEGVLLKNTHSKNFLLKLPCGELPRGEVGFTVCNTVHFERKGGNFKSFQKRKLEKNFCQYRMYIKSSFMEFLILSSGLRII